MHIAIYERNLLWSVRLQKHVESLGHSAEVLGEAVMPESFADLAILNLGEPNLSTEEIIEGLKSQGTTVVGHAGHKETPLWDAGREHGCDHIVSNGTLAHKLDQVLALASASLR
ncbi:MAG: hypothetical protein JST40_03240 [Armatimonadetes bacterium]|nr:hypothetical protein [Armatimonadota bacterium]